MISANADDASVIEMTDVYNDSMEPSPLRMSLKRTPRSLREVPAQWDKVSDHAPHFLDSKRKFFCQMAFAFLLVSVIQVSLQWNDCRISAEKFDSASSSEEVAYVGAGLCIDPIAEILDVLFFSAVLFLGYLIREELILGSPLIFSFVKQMKPDDVNKLQIKNEEEWTNVLTGKHERFRPRNIRGHVLLPTITALIAFLNFLNRGRIRTEDRECSTGAYGCGPDNEWAISTISIIFCIHRCATQQAAFCGTCDHDRGLSFSRGISHHTFSG